MTPKSLESLLAGHTFFEGLPERHLETLAGCASNVRFEPKEFLFREGEDADTFYVIREGRVALETHAPGHGPGTVATLEPGHVLGWSWLFPPYRWHLDARAIEPVRALAFDGKCLRGKCEADHGLGFEMMKRFSRIMLERLQAARLQALDIYGTDR